MSAARASLVVLLHACAEVPSITIPVAVPPAENGAAMPASTYVQPAVTTLDDTALCGEPDVRGYLADGSFGWRVLELRENQGPYALTGEPLRDVAPRWRAADARVAEVCGTHDRGAVLIVADRGRAFEGVALTVVRDLLPDADLHLLVSDATPGALVPARPETGDQWTFVVTARSWALLPFSGDDAVELFTRADAVSELLRRDPGVVVVVVDGGTWGSVTAELDAFAPHGVRPAFGRSVGGGSAVAQEKPAPGVTRIVLTDTLAVLPLGGPSRIMLMQVIGASDGDPGAVEGGETP